MDILLMTTNFDYQSFIEPFGISILAAICKEKNMLTYVLEPAVKALSWEACADIIIEKAPKILAVSILIDLNVKSVLLLLERVRQTLPAIKVIVGGQAVTMNYAQPSYRTLFSNVNAFMYGESEMIFGDLVNALLCEEPYTHIKGIGYCDAEGGIHRNPPAPIAADLDALPDMDRSVLKEIQKENPFYRETSVQYGRGCKYACSFCSIGALFGDSDQHCKLRRRSIKRLMEEIAFLFYQYGIRSFFIEDESFLDQDETEKEKVIWLCRQIQKLPEKITLKILARIDCIDETVCRSLYEAGFKNLFLGVDSVVADDLKRFRKGYARALVEEKLAVLRAIGYSTDVAASYRVQIGYITWHPYTTVAGLKESLDFFEQYGCTPKLLEHKLFVFEATPLRVQIKEDGLLLDDKLQEGMFELRWAFRDETVAKLHHEMRRYFNEWSPLRDGIRMIEKYIVLENPGYAIDISELVSIRKELDSHFYQFFKKLLQSNSAGLQAVTAFHIDELYCFYSHKTTQEIDRFCSRYQSLTNIVAAIREKSLWLTRYRD